MTTRTQRGTGLPMKVLLCLPPGGFLADKDGLMPTSGLAPLGLASMAEVLEQHDVAVEILDAHAQGLSLGKVRRLLQHARPDVVGVTFTTESRRPGFRFIRAARQALPRAWIVAGSPHVTFAAQDTLDHVAELDAVCRGEGEYTLRDAIASLERGTGFKDIAGISYRQDNRVIHNPPRPFLQDLDTLPLPARHLLDMKLYERFVVDLPTETMEEARLTLNLMEELGGDSSLGVLKVYPGTRLEQLAREKGILPDDFTWTRKAERRVVSVPAVAGDAPPCSRTV